MHRQLRYYLQFLLFIFDLIVLNLSLGILLLVYTDYSFFKLPSPYSTYCIFLNLYWIIASLLFGAYGDSIILKFEFFAKRTVQVYIAWVIMVLFYLVFSKQVEISLLFILFSIFGFSLGLLLTRFLFFGFKDYIRYQQSLVTKVIILGYNETAKKLARYFEEEGVNTQLLGFVEDTRNISELSNYPILGNIGSTIRLAHDLGVNEIISTITPEQNKFIYSLMSDAENECMRFKVVPDLSFFFSKPVIIDYIQNMPVLSLRGDPLEDVGNRIKKRVLDVAISATVSIFILSWMIPLIGIIIKLESSGPVLFAQTRTGKNNKPFRCLKFRSMFINSESDTMSATKNDSRVTKIGAFLRKTSLDEFPQFWNVLKGEMSLVGPRPHMVKHTSDFSKMVDHYMIRQFLKPGITGWAQINSFRGEITDPIQIKRRVASDIWYLEHWNIWLDLRILFLTIYQVFTGNDHAY
jgi:putative colanic acid biosynthesis UDP-glucose lipid carrier transferase